MKILKDKKVITLIAILLVFTIGYFIAVNKVSYAFTTDIDPKDSYDNLIKIVEKCARVYATKNKDVFGEEKIAYIKIQDLIDKGYIAPNSDGNITNPIKKEETLNSKIIKLKKDGEKIEVEVDS